MTCSLLIYRIISLWEKCSKRTWLWPAKALLIWFWPSWFQARPLLSITNVTYGIAPSNIKDRISSTFFLLCTFNSICVEGSNTHFMVFTAFSTALAGKLLSLSSFLEYFDWNNTTFNCESCASTIYAASNPPSLPPSVKYCTASVKSISKYAATPNTKNALERFLSLSLAVKISWLSSNILFILWSMICFAISIIHTYL